MKRLSLILTASCLATSATLGQQTSQDLEQRVALNTAVNRQQDARLAGLESDVSHLKSSSQIAHPPQYPHPSTPATPGQPAATSTYAVASGDTFFSIARRHSTSITQLQAANPGVDPSRLQIGQRLNVPGTTAQQPPAAPHAHSPVPPPTSAIPYRVVAGDTLSSIARRHGTSVAALQRANGLSSDSLQVGQNLLIPTAAAPAGDVATSPPYPAPAPPQPSPTPALQPPSTSFTHTVQPGETLSAIARQYNTSISAIVASTPGLSNPNQLKIGQQLTIPGANANSIASQQGSPQAQPSPPPASSPPAYTSLLNYELRPGETLDSIAPKFGTSTAEIIRINGLQSASVVRPGDIILVPGNSLQAGHTGP
jgi:LysM repeat protein